MVVLTRPRPHIDCMTMQLFILVRQTMVARWRAICLAALLAMPAFLITPAAQAEPLAEAIDRIGGNVLFLRHALAPGFGDPARFDVDDCASQRNLDEAGREQARAIGAYMTRHAITPDIILSSQWCRCQDTASEMAIGPFSTHIGLNSFFNGHVDRDLTLAALREYMAQIEPDRLELMVTHQVVISAITGIAPRSGGMVVYNSRSGEAVSVPPLVK
jgi:phosphohistidine phosphatase SixA